MDKILIVEDDEAIAQIYKIALTHRKHEAEIAIDGIEGVEKAKELKPKLILLDIMMPRKNGVEVMEELKADPTTQNIPIFVLSNLVDLEMIDKMKKFGALKYLVKSQYTPDQIVDIIEEFFINPNQHENTPPVLTVSPTPEEKPMEEGQDLAPTQINLNSQGESSTNSHNNPDQPTTNPNPTEINPTSTQ